MLGRKPMSVYLHGKPPNNFQNRGTILRSPQQHTGTLAFTSASARAVPSSGYFVRPNRWESAFVLEVSCILFTINHVKHLSICLFNIRSLEKGRLSLWSSVCSSFLPNFCLDCLISHCCV